MGIVYLIITDLLPVTCLKLIQLEAQFGGHCGRDRMAVGFTTTFIQLVPITTKVVSSNPTHSWQHYVIKFVSDLQQVWVFFFHLRGGGGRGLRFHPPMKLTATL